MPALIIAALMMVCGTSADANASQCPDDKEGLALLSHSARTINNDPMSFCVYGTRESDVLWLWSIHVQHADGQYLGELVYPEAAEGLGLFNIREVGGRSPAPEFQDMNFDGASDIRLLAFVGSGGVGYHYWIYQPASGQFEYNRAMSGQDMRVDSTTGELRSTWEGGHAGRLFNQRTYQWRDNRLVLVKEVSQQWEADRACYLKQTRQRINDELQLAFSECQPVD